MRIGFSHHRLYSNEIDFVSEVEIAFFVADFGIYCIETVSAQHPFPVVAGDRPGPQLAWSRSRTIDHGRRRLPDISPGPQPDDLTRFRQRSQPAVFPRGRHVRSRWIRTGRDYGPIELVEHSHNDRLGRDTYARASRRSQATGQRALGGQYQGYRPRPETLGQCNGVSRHSYTPVAQIVGMTKKRRKRTVSLSSLKPANGLNCRIRGCQGAEGILSLRWSNRQSIVAKTTHQRMNGGSGGPGSLESNDAP